MTCLEWQDKFVTGIDYIDFEHRQLLKTLNDIFENLNKPDCHEVTGDYLGLLYERICAHCALEEAVMAEKHYAQFARHKAQHEQLLDQIRNMMDAYEDGRCDNCDMSLKDCLSDWFQSHLQGEDELPGV